MKIAFLCLVFSFVSVSVHANSEELAPIYEPGTYSTSFQILDSSIYSQAEVVFESVEKTIAVNLRQMPSCDSDFCAQVMPAIESYTINNAILSFDECENIIIEGIDDRMDLDGTYTAITVTDRSETACFYFAPVDTTTLIFKRTFFDPLDQVRVDTKLETGTMQALR